METLPAMNEFLAAIYRQHTQQTAQNNLNKVQNQVQYLESFKELLQKRQEDEKKEMTSELHSLVQKSCRVCGAAIGQTTFQSAAKFDLQEALLNCLKIDIRNDSPGLPLRVCQSCTEQLTGAMIRYSHSGLWPTLSHINKFNWGNRIDDSESDHGTSGHVKKGTNECTLAQTLPSLCTISAKHGFLLVPEHTDERRVRFVRLVEIATNDVCASFILHIYIDLTWDVSIHGHSIDMGLLMRNMDLPRKVTRENAEQLFTSMLKLNLCPGIDGLNPICRIISQNGPAVFHDHQNQKLAVEDRFSKTVRHNDCDIVSGIDGGKQCEACSKYQPIVLQFQEKCLSLSKMNHSSNPTPPSKSPKKLNANLNFNGNLGSVAKTENNFEKKEAASLTENDDSMSPSKKPIRMEVNESIKIDQPTSADGRPGGSDSESRSPTENDSKILESKYNKMRETLGAHPASGLSLLAESAARLPLTADRPNMREQLLAKAVEKKQACGRCDRCLRLDDCGNCDYCLDKPKFGGPNTKRRKCRQRTCVYYRQAQNSSRKRPASSQNFRMDNTSLMASLNSNFLNSNFRKSDQSKSNDKKLNQDAKMAKNSLSSSGDKGLSIGSGSGGQTNGHETQGSSNRRRPALQCHQCKHCAAPDCAKCRFCLDKPKFGGPGRLKQKCIERRCTLERQQDLEIKKEKERKNANALFAKEFQAATNQLASQIFKNTSLVGDSEVGSTGSTSGGGGVTFPKPLLNHMTDALKRQHQQLLNSSTTNQSNDQLEPTQVSKMDEDDDEDVEVDVDDP